MYIHVYIIYKYAKSLLNVLIYLKLLEDFIEEFFYQNPISQLGIIITRNKRAEKISDLAGNLKKHIKVTLCFIIFLLKFKIHLLHSFIHSVISLEK